LLCAHHWSYFVVILHLAFMFVACNGLLVVIINRLCPWWQEVWSQLSKPNDDRAVFAVIQRDLKAAEKRVEEGQIVLQILEKRLICLACVDAGADITTRLLLPLTQERLEARAADFAAELPELNLGSEAAQPSDTESDGVRQGVPLEETHAIERLEVRNALTSTQGRQKGSSQHGCAMAGWVAVWVWFSSHCGPLSSLSVSVS
jgi:hypothetical protein